MSQFFSSLFILLFVVCTNGRHENPSTLPSHAVSTCFAHTIDSSQINQCVHKMNVPNCNRLDVSVNGRQSYEACACNLTVSGGVDVAFVLDQTPNLNDSDAVAGSSPFNAETWWISLTKNLQQLTNNILKGDSRVTAYGAYSNVNGNKIRSITNGLISPSEWHSQTVSYQNYPCPNFADDNAPCHSLSYTCEAIRRAMEDLDTIGNEGRRKVLIVFWINRALDLNDCQNLDVFTKRRSDLSVVNIGASLTVDGKEWTGALRDEMLHIAGNVTDNFIFNNAFFSEIRDNGEKPCSETRYCNLLILRNRKSIANDIEPFLCSIYPNPKMNEIFWVTDAEQNFFRKGLALVSDHLCLQKPMTESPSRSAHTQSPVTSAPSTYSSMTSAPLTAEPSTSQPTTAAPSKLPPTKRPLISEPTTSQPSTLNPTTAAPMTVQPTTSAPTTEAPVTERPTSSSSSPTWWRTHTHAPSASPSKVPTWWRQ